MKFSKYGSSLCFVLCLLSWVPNIIFQIASPFWLLTFICAPIGIGLAVNGKSPMLMIGNIIMFFSFFILMFLGYLINWLTGGKP